MITLERLFSPVQRQRLLAAIHRRASCRSYTAAPSPADWAALSYAAGRYELPGARLILARVDEPLFTGTLLGMGRVTGCTALAAVAVSASEPRARLHAGVLGEAFVLEATHLGLGTCWVSGSYRKKLLNVPLRADEAVLCVIAVGVPARGSINPTQRRRKPVERLCRGDIRLWPEELQRAAMAVQAAPSAMNMQPWQMSLSGERFELDGSDRSMLDLGIAMCHAELALTTPHRWRFGAGRGEPVCWAETR